MARVQRRRVGQRQYHQHHHQQQRSAFVTPFQEAMERVRPISSSVDYVNLKLLAVRCEAVTPVSVIVSFAS
jgi:hypothetical protein